MPKTKYYTPQLRRELISPLYHAAKAKGIPMTALASRLVADGLYRMAQDREEACIVAEEPPGNDPPVITCDGKPVTGRIEGNRIWVDNVGTGSHTFSE